MKQNSVPEEVREAIQYSANSARNLSATNIYAADSGIDMEISREMILSCLDPLHDEYPQLFKQGESEFKNGDLDAGSTIMEDNSECQKRLSL